MPLSFEDEIDRTGYGLYAAPAHHSLRPVGRKEKRDHSFLSEHDQCYYIWQYFAGMGRAGGPVNRLILDLKSAPEDPAGLEAKEAAITHCAHVLGRALTWASVQGYTFVPIPPSKRRDNPLYDQRLRRILDQVRPHLPDIRELISQTYSVPAGIKGLSVAERVAQWQLGDDSSRPEPTNIVIFDELLTSGNHFKAAKTLLQGRYSGAQILGIFLARRCTKPVSGLGVSVTPGQTRILTSGKTLDEVSSVAVQALQSKSPSPLMVRDDHLVRVRQSAGTARRPVRLTAQTLSAPALRGILARHAKFVAYGKGGERYIDPPIPVVKDIMSMSSWPFPILMGIVESPTLRPDGTLILRPGYDKATGLIYNPSEDCRSMRVPVRPTCSEIQEAVRYILDECLGDFPFVGASRANVLALLLTPIVRPAVGCVPLAIVDSPVPGCGKSLLCSVLGRIVTGRTVPKRSLPEEEPEVRKCISSLLDSAEPLCVFDNVDGVIRSHHLAAVLTAETWGDRNLGHIQEIHLENNATWVANGNRVRVAGDMPRRCYRIRLQAREECPWLRRDFRHPQLERWVSTHRRQLLQALLTLVQSYVVDPGVYEFPVLGSFEGWCRVVGTILKIAGVTGFLSDCIPTTTTHGTQKELLATAE